MTMPEAPTTPGEDRSWCAVIDEITCDPAQAERIFSSPAIGDNFVSDAHGRFSEVLFRNADGYWFLVRPLAPDEAREWLEHPHHDHILARQLFPDSDQVMILLTVTRRCLRADGSLGAKALVIQIDDDAGMTTAGLHPNGCRGVEAAAVLRPTPALIAAETAIRDLVDQVRTALGDQP